MAVTQDNKLYGWGDCMYGKLGNKKTNGVEYLPV